MTRALMLLVLVAMPASAGLGLAAVQRPQAPVREATGGQELPGHAAAFLRHRFPGWRLMPMADFDDDVVRFVRQRFGETASPGRCSGDLDGNGLRDIALIMRRADQVKVLVLRQLKPRRWTADELSSFPFSSGFQAGCCGFCVFLTPRSPGLVAFRPEEGAAKSGRLQLKNDAVEVRFYGKATAMHYWTGKGYARVVTAD